MEPWEARTGDLLVESNILIRIRCLQTRNLHETHFQMNGSHNIFISLYFTLSELFNVKCRNKPISWSVSLLSTVVTEKPMTHVCTRSLFVQYNYIMLSPGSTQCLLVPTRLPLSSPILTGGGGGLDRASGKI